MKRDNTVKKNNKPDKSVLPYKTAMLLITGLIVLIVGTIIISLTFKTL